MNQKKRKDSGSGSPGVLGSRAVRFGSIAGVTVALDWSLLIIFALITFSLAGGVLPYWHPDWSGFTVPGPPP